MEANVRAPLEAHPVCMFRRRVLQGSSRGSPAPSRKGGSASAPPARMKASGSEGDLEALGKEATCALYLHAMEEFLILCERVLRPRRAVSL